MSTTQTEDQQGGADLSACGRYRYRLWRAWGPGSRLGFVMLNPSTADASKDDPTIRKCMGFARRNGCDGIEVVNLFAWRATDPRDLLRAMDAGADIVGPRNNDATLALLEQPARLVVVAWGVLPSARLARREVDIGGGLLALAPDSLRCIGRTRDGHPRHPLMAPYAPLERWK